MMFERPVLLIAVPLLTAAITTLALVARRRRERAAAAWSRALGERARSLGRRSPWVLGLAALAASIGLAGPRWGSTPGLAEARSLNIVVVMDVSRSMLARDVAPDRLQRAVSLARRLVQDLDGNRFALVAFAGHAYLLSPLTLDASAITLQLDAVDPDMVSVGGSGLAGGLDLARRTLVSSPQGGDRAVVVFSDGEAFDGPGPLESAGRALRRAGVTVVAVPVGDIRGARIPEANGDWHRDAAGNVVITTRRDDLLQAMTRAAEGTFISAAAPDPVGDARQALAHLNRARTTDRVAADLVPRAWVFALIAVLLLLGQTLTRRSAALVSIALAVAAGTASAQRPTAGTRLLARGDTARARQAFAADVKAEPNDTGWFNAGTSALLAGDLGVAADALQRATLSLDPGLRQRALYNLGTAYLLQARRDTVHRDTLLTAATNQLQQALLLAPNDRNAKFNFELARHLRPPPKASSGAGKSKANGPPPPPPPSAPQSGMTPAQADQVLSAMERAERETRERQQQRVRRGEPPPGPDW